MPFNRFSDVLGCSGVPLAQVSGDGAFLGCPVIISRQDSPWLADGVDGGLRGADPAIFFSGLRGWAAAGGSHA